MRRLAKATALVVAIALATALVALGILIHRPLPAIDADIRLLGLRERGEIVRDRYGVPRISARNAHDLFFLQGYALAQDRLFQMDLYRRAALGRLSEVFGDRTLEADRLMRTLTLGHAARRDEALLGPDARAAVDAFAAGVNKFLEQRGESLPLEFVLLGYRPDLWSPLDSLAILKLQAFDQAVNFETELLRLDVARRLGVEAIPTLFPEPPGTPPLDEAWRRIAPHVPAGGGRSGAIPGLAELRAILPSGGMAGSNCWAVGGGRTATGRPLLAADPHLGVRNPSIWYELGLDGAGYRVMGFTIPGVPGVILGHNERIAWSLTVAYVDQQDLYVERRDPADPERFLFRDGSERATVHRERIGVKGRGDVPIEVVVTRHGPIITPVLPGESALLALRWTALDGGRNLDAILALDRARDWASFRAALDLTEGPALTLCYADADGNVGRILAGRIPVRADPADGRLPLPGWSGEHDWRADRRGPAELAGADGLFVVANQAWTDLAGAGSPAEWDQGFRARRASDLLGGRSGLRADDLRRMQTDDLSLPSARFRPLIEATTGGSAAATRARELLRGWDGRLEPGSAAAAVHQTFAFHLLRRVVADRLGEPLFARYVRDGRPLWALHELVGRPDHPWLATSGLAALSAAALDDAAAELVRRQGPDSARWRWGGLHRITFTHPLGSAIPFGVLNIGPHDVGGDDDTINDAPYDLERPYAVKTHASLRMVVDLSGDVRASSVLPTGQSGQPGSRFWGDQTALWLRGELKPMPLVRERMEGEIQRLVLRPR